MADPVTPAAPAAQPNTESGSAKPVPAEGAVPPAPPAPPQLYTVTINGQEKQVTLEQLQRMAQKGEGADQRFAKASEVEKRAKAALDELKADPIAALVKLGIDPDSALADFVKKKAAESALSEEEREKLKLTRERDEFKRKADDAAKKDAEAKQAELDARNGERLEALLLKAAEELKVPNAPELLYDAVTVALEALELGYELTPQQMWQEAMWRADEQAGAFGKKKLSALSGEALLQFLGDEVVKRVQEATKTRIPGPPKTAAKKPNGEEKPKVPKKGYVSELEFNRKWLK